MKASNSIKLFKASNFSYTPFENFFPGDMEYLNSHDIEIVSSDKLADVIISQNYKHIKKHFWKFILGKKFLIWTLEPRFDTHFVSSKKVFFGLATCHFMNIYTRDIFVRNVTIHAGIINKKLDKIPDGFNLESRKIIALMSYFKGVDAPKFIKDGENIDLISIRSKIAIEGTERNIVDIVGKGWPIGVAIEDSRSGDWSPRKKELLKQYNFNLAFENTATFNYMTEKLWDSIENYCLPIYYGKGTNAYEIFPKDSFIDYSEFSGSDELFDFIENISNKEFIERMNKCIEVYNSISNQGQDFVKKCREEMLDKIVEKLELLKK